MLTYLSQYRKAAAAGLLGFLAPLLAVLAVGGTIDTTTWQNAVIGLVVGAGGIGWIPNAKDRSEVVAAASDLSRGDLLDAVHAAAALLHDHLRQVGTLIERVTPTPAAAPTADVPPATGASGVTAPPPVALAPVVDAPTPAPEPVTDPFAPPAPTANPATA